MPVFPMINWLIWAAIWVAIAFWPARVASRKGHSFLLYFLFSLVFFPLALIVAYIVKDKNMPAAAPTPTAEVTPEA